PSHAAMLTGMYPSSSGVRVHMVDRIPDDLETLATSFARAGYETAGIYSWMSLDPDYSGFQRGFQLYQSAAPRRTGAQESLETAKGRADLTTDAAIEQLKRLVDRPFFMWVHYFDPHYPYAPPDALADQYDRDYRGPIDSTMKTIEAIQNGQLSPQGRDLK